MPSMTLANAGFTVVSRSPRRAWRMGTPALSRVNIWRLKRLRSTSVTLPRKKRPRSAPSTSWPARASAMSMGVTPLLKSWVATASGEAASSSPRTASPRWLRARYWNSGTVSILHAVGDAQHLFHRGDALGRQRDGAAPQAVELGLLLRGVGELLGIARVQRLDERLVDLQVFKDTDAALVAGGVTVTATAPAPELQRIGPISDLPPHHGLHCGGDLRGLRAGLADAPHQPLGNDSAQRGRDHVGRDPHVDEPQRRGEGVVRVQGREHHVAGHGGAQADLGGLLVAHLAHENHVRVLAQHGAQ